MYNYSIIPYYTVLISVSDGLLLYRSTFIKYNFESDGLGPVAADTPNLRPPYRRTPMFFASCLVQRSGSRTGRERAHPFFHLPSTDPPCIPHEG
jgi:hypothetical protein